MHAAAVVDLPAHLLRVIFLVTPVVLLFELLIIEINPTVQC